MATVNVLTESKSLELIGQTVVDAGIVNGEMILTTGNGTPLNLGVVRGSAAPNPTAQQTTFTPTGTIAATTLQNAISELGTDVINLDNNKIDLADVPKIARGTVAVTDMGTGSRDQDAVKSDFSDVFPVGFFTKIPRVALVPILSRWSDSNEPNPSNLFAYGMYSVSLTGFWTITNVLIYPPGGNLRFMYIAVQPP